MKSTILNLNKRVLVVEISKDVKIEQTSETNLKLNDTEIIGLEGFPFEEEFDANFICIGSELSEEIAKGLALKSMNQHWRNLNRKKEDFSDLWLNSALDSFISSIEANGFTWGNPIELIGRGEASEHDRVINQNEYNEAESKTFHPDRVLIFEIV